MLRASVIALMVLGAGCAATREIGAVAFHFMTMVNPSSLDRRELPHGIEGVCSRGSLSWIIPTSDGGVVLIDTGFDDEARAINYALRGRTLHAIFLTHAHVDHAAGTHTLDAPVYVGHDDAPALRGEHTFTALYPLLGEALAGIPPARGEVREVHGGETITIGDVQLEAIAVPGHTHGSIAWRFRDVLFGGDAIQSPLGDEVFPAPVGFTIDIHGAYDSLRRLRDLDVAYLADAHSGVMKDPMPAIRRALERDHDDVERLQYPLLRPIGCGDDPA